MEEKGAAKEEEKKKKAEMLKTTQNTTRAGSSNPSTMPTTALQSPPRLNINPTAANLKYDAARELHAVAQKYREEGAKRMEAWDNDDGGMNATCPYCGVAMTLYEFGFHKSM